MKMTKYDRLLFILNLLRTRRNLNAARIAEECGVTERTIYRDIIAISEANIPIYYDNGYKYASDNFLPPLNISVDEYLTLSAALDSTPLAELGHSKHILKSVRTKIEAVLSQTVRKEKSDTAIPANIRIRSTTHAEVKDKFYAAVEKAIRQKLVLHLKYAAIESGVKERDVEPYFMIFIERAFYFVAHCRMRKGLRTFRLDRIEDITVTEEQFTPRENIDPEGYFKDSWGVFGGAPVEVEVIFKDKAARVVLTGKHHENEIVEKIGNNRVRYNVNVSGTDEIMRWIVGFGGDARVVKPSSLARKIAQHARDILDSYS